MKQLKSQRENNRAYQERRRRKLGILSRKDTQNSTETHFIIESNKVHRNKYDYSSVDYNGAIRKVEIICPIHGKFTQTPDAHKRGQGCPLCAQTSRNGTRKRKTTKQFVQEATQCHNSRYIYTKTKYVNIKTKVKIVCGEHGEFLQTPKAHLVGQGCPSCANIQRASFFESKGERIVEEYLIEHHIPHVKQKTFPECKHKMLLRFDFYLTSHNILVEYDGEQHYKFLPKFHGDISGFVLQQSRDNIKTEYAESNNISLIRIRWNQDIKGVLDDNI